jgi:hypothetical protein
MLSFNPYCWLALHITLTPTFGEFMHTGSPQLVELWSCVSSPLLSHTPHKRRTGGSRGATQQGVWSDLGGISQLTYWRQRWILVQFIFIFYFVRLPQCNKYSDVIVTFISIHSFIIYVVFFGACMRCTRLYPLNPGVTEVVSEEMLIGKWLTGLLGPRAAAGVRRPAKMISGLRWGSVGSKSLESSMGHWRN